MLFFWKRSSKPRVVTVTAAEAFERVAANKQARMVDVRESREWDSTGTPAKAVRISLGNLARKAPEKLPMKDKPVYLICASGHRSAKGAKILVGLGYREVYSVSGGIRAWLKAGLPVKRG
jgi:rhodanese-related sulfurtransferase